MGWKGAIRTIAAAQRRAEREAQRRRRELEKEHQRYMKMQELEQAAYDVQEYENYVSLLTSVHKECSNNWDWESIKSSEQPEKPDKSSAYENQARTILNNYKPSVFDKLFNKIEKKQSHMVTEIENAIEKDEQKNKNELNKYEQEFEDWKNAKELATKILEGSPEAYLEAINQTEPFADINELGSSIEFIVRDKTTIEANMHVNSEKVVPKEIKSLLKSGKLSVKNMPKGLFFELYQDYVCSCILRVVREIFALLPIEAVLINAKGKLLSSKTGHIEEQTILSVAIPIKTLNNINLDMIDPSDSMENFVHNMSFKKSKGFEAVNDVEISELDIN